MADRIILASKSPRRQFLLKAIGLKPEIRTRDVNESFPGRLRGKEIALFLCRKKAGAFVHDLQPNELIITADTIVWIRGKVLNKPRNAKDAARMLKQLSGRTHSVYTGVCLLTMTSGGRPHFRTFSTRSDVTFRKLSDEEIRYYITHYRPFDKAGAYGAQEGLPAGMNPCSAAEKKFLRRIGRPGLYKQGNYRKKNSQPVHIVDRIRGSYFNVMGLPILELHRELSGS